MTETPELRQSLRRQQERITELQRVVARLVADQHADNLANVSGWFRVVRGTMDQRQRHYEAHVYQGGQLFSLRVSHVVDPLSADDAWLSLTIDGQPETDEEWQLRLESSPPDFTPPWGEPRQAGTP